MAPTVPLLVPPETVKATVAPPIVSAFPAASRACSVSVTVPPAEIVSLDTETVDVAGEIVPGVTVTVGAVVVTGAALIVAPIVVAAPAITPVNVAVYVPLPLSVVAPIVPVLAPPEKVKATVAPPVVMLFAAASFPCNVRVTALPDATLPADVLIVEVAAEIIPTAVALNVMGVTVGNAGTLAWKLWAPGVVPSTPVTLARPSAPAVTVVSAGAPPESERNRTPTPPTGRLSDARTSTSSGVLSGCPGAASCPPPAMLRSWVGSGTNVTVTESPTPAGVRARTRTVERVPGARSTPKPLMCATAVSLVLQAT